MSVIVRLSQLTTKLVQPTRLNTSNTFWRTYIL